MKRRANGETKSGLASIDREIATGHCLHRRTARYAVSVASALCFPQRRLIGGHAVGEGYWYTFAGEENTIAAADISTLQTKISSLIKENAAIDALELPYSEAIALLAEQNQPIAVKLLQTRVKRVIKLHKTNEQVRLALHPLHKSFGELAKDPYTVTLKQYKHGFVVVYSSEYKEEPAIAEAIHEHTQWALKCHEVQSLADLNKVSIDRSEEGRQDFILQSEFRQEQKLTRIAEMVNDKNTGADKSKHVRVLAIAGPTSSGKTTFAHKLSLYLKNFGYASKALSVDHYYLSLPDQPKFIETGKRELVDYDSIESMDISLINKHINQLIQGETIEAPEYDFKSGLRKEKGHEFTLPSHGILVIEGIHALNPEYTAGIPKENVFKIYISPISGLLVDDFNAIKTTNHRLMRRMTRDYLFRGYSAEATLSKWSMVRRGEHRYIFAHQNNADYVMNSAMEFEIPVLKTYVEPLLNCVTPDCKDFERAQELLGCLSLVAAWPEVQVPNVSIFREFIGNGSFDKH